MLTGAATVFTVRDMTKSVEHHCNAFGFALNFQYGNPIFYTCLGRDEVALHLLAAQQTKRLPGNGLERQQRELEQMRQAIANYTGPVTKCPPGRSTNVLPRRRVQGEQKKASTGSSENTP